MAAALRTQGFAVRVARELRCATTVTNVDFSALARSAGGDLLWCAVAQGTRSSHSFHAFSEDAPPLWEVSLERDNVACTLFVQAGEGGREDALRAALRSLD